MVKKNVDFVESLLFLFERKEVFLMSKRRMYEVSNSFHGTKCRTSFSPKKRNEIELKALAGKATSRELSAMRRCKKRLCGVKGCCCSNGWGERR